MHANGRCRHFPDSLTADRRPRGALLSELLVAATLTSTAFLVFVPTVGRVLRIQQALQHDQLACDALNAELETISLLPVSQLESHLDSLSLPESLSRQLPDAVLHGQLIARDAGYQIVLTLSWRDPGRTERPLSMTTWVYPCETGEERPDGT